MDYRIFMFHAALYLRLLLSKKFICSGVNRRDVRVPWQSGEWRRPVQSGGQVRVAGQNPAQVEGDWPQSAHLLSDDYLHAHPRRLLHFQK